MTDAIDLSSAEIVRGPKDVASWTPTVDITKLTMKPGEDKGQSFEAAVPLTWDFHVPGWGDPAAGDDGNVLYTVWAVINVNGRLYASGFIQMWKGRQWTGAPILTSYENWWGDARGLWGPMKDYVPSVGSTVGFFLTAGNGRLVDGVTSVKERTNVVAVQIPAGNSGEWNFKTAASPAPATPQAPPAQPPAQATTPAGPAAQSPAPSDDRMNALLKTDRKSVV